MSRVAGDPLTAGPGDPRACDGSLVRAFGFLGKRWNGVLIATLGAGPAGFAGLRRALGISDSMLADRLAELTRAGLVTREVDEGPPVAVSYALSAAGADLLPVLEALARWSGDNLTDQGCARAR